MSKVVDFAKGAKKFLAALAAAVGVLVTNGLLEGETATLASTIIAALGAFLVYLVPNETDAL